MGKKRLAIICSTDYKTYPMGGMMSFITDIVPYLSKDFEITLWGVSAGLIEDFQIDINGNVFPLKIFSKVKINRKIIPNMLRVVFSLLIKMKDLISENYDILYFHGIPLSLPFLLRKKFYNVPLIVNHIHGVTNPFKVNQSKFARNTLIVNLYQLYRKWVVLNSDLIFLAADNDAYKNFLNQFKQSIKKKIMRIPNFADPVIFHPIDKKTARLQLNLPVDAKIFINTGRISFQKDPFLLLDVFNFLKKDFKIDSLLIMIGDGELKNDMESKVKELNLSSCVKLFGPVKREQISLWLNAADIFVYTSFGNGIPVSLIEAGMCGLPIVSTDITGVHDIVIDGDTGYLVGNRDYKDIAAKVEVALENRDKLSETMLKITKNLTPANTAEEITKILSKSI